MTSEEWRELFTKKLSEAEKRLEDFKSMRFRLIEHGGRDITEQHLASLQSEVDEYRKVLE